MSMVELRRNSLPHLGVLPLVASPPVWRKASHPPLAIQREQIVIVATPPAPEEEEDEEIPFDDEMDEENPRSVSPDVFLRLIAEAGDINELVRTITHESKRIIKTETVTLFLVDQENDELVATIFKRNDRHLSEIRLPMNRGIVGRCLAIKGIVNVRDVNRCPYFYVRIDQLTGFKAQNILCVPLIDLTGAYIGVLELGNREGIRGFTRTDEVLSKHFASYCATSLSHCLLYQKVHEAQIHFHMAGEWPDNPNSVDPQEAKRLAVQPVATWQAIHPDFASFAFAPRQIGSDLEYCKAAMTFFVDLGFTQLYSIRQDILANFVVRVANGYRDVAYHNWSHAFAVAHFAWNALKTQRVRKNLDEMERLALLIACLCHDIDHRGTNNKFQVERKTPLAQLYSSEGSVLERHHYAQTVMILRSAECNVLQALTRTQYQCVMNNIRESILATDIAVHVQKVPRFRELIRVGFNDLSHDHHYLFMCLVMTASDLSDQSKDFHNSKAIAENIYREFFSQGDMEKAQGAVPMDMMDRDRANVAQIQLEFMDNIAVPVFEILAALLPEGRATYASITNNRTCWKTLDEILDRRGEQILGLDYLHDERLEREVIAEVARRRLIPGPIPPQPAPAARGPPAQPSIQPQSPQQKQPQHNYKLRR